jgi:hypothetical protein
MSYHPEMDIIGLYICWLAQCREEKKAKCSYTLVYIFRIKSSHEGLYYFLVV